MGIAVWWRNYADPNMATLTDANSGPFMKCRVELGRHEILALWEAEQAPGGSFRNAKTE